MKKKIFQSFFASIIIGTSILTLAACKKTSNDIKIKETKDPDDPLVFQLQEYVQNSLSVMKALVLAKSHGYDVKTMLRHRLNMKGDIKKDLNCFFNNNFLKNYDYLTLFKNPELTQELFKESTTFPLAQNRNETGLLSLVRVLLTFITQRNLTGNNEAFNDILGRNLEESFKFYQKSDYKKFISLLSIKLKEHNNFIRQGKNYAEVLEWSSKNIRTTLLKLCTGTQEIKDLDKEYELMMKKILSFDIITQGWVWKREFKELKVKTDSVLLETLKKQIKKPENIIELAISAIPLLVYVLKTVENIPLNNAYETWNNKGELPIEIKNFVNGQLKKEYDIFQEMSIAKLIEQFRTILKVDDGGLSLRKLMLTITTAPNIQKIFNGINVDIAFLDFNVIELFALGQISIIGFKKSIFTQDIFEIIKKQLEPKLNEYFEFIESNIDKYEKFQKNLMAGIVLISKNDFFNIKEIFFVVEELVDKLNDMMTEQSNVIIKAHQEGQESFFKTLRNILNGSINNKKALQDILDDKRICKINQTVCTFYKIGISSFGIPELLKIIESNDNHYFNNLKEKYSSEKWEVTNIQLQEFKDHHVITYTINYKFENQEHQYNIELQTASKVSKQSLITQFVKVN